MKILFLDDDPTRHKRFKEAHIGCDVVYTWTALEAIAALRLHHFEQASLDHDLAVELNMRLPGEGEGSGYDVALFITTLPEARRPALVVLHSFNRAGAHRMGMALRASDRRMRIHYQPFDY